MYDATAVAFTWFAGIIGNGAVKAIDQTTMGLKMYDVVCPSSNVIHAYRITPNPKLHRASRERIHPA